MLFTAACIDVIDGVGPVALLLGTEADPGQPKLMHLPMMLHSLSRRSEAAHGDFTEADEVKVELHDYKAYHGLNQFAAELLRTQFEQTVPLNVAIRAPRKNRGQTRVV